MVGFIARIMLHYIFIIVRASVYRFINDLYDEIILHLTFYPFICTVAPAQTPSTNTPLPAAEPI